MAEQRKGVEFSQHEGKCNIGARPYHARQADCDPRLRTGQFKPAVVESLHPQSADPS